MKIAIIGGGNLGSAIAAGLLKSNFCAAENITVTKRNIATLAWLQEKGINISTNNKEATANADVIILAIKPFQIKEILEEIASRLSKNQLLISVVT